MSCYGETRQPSNRITTEAFLPVKLARFIEIFGIPIQLQIPVARGACQKCCKTQKSTEVFPKKRCFTNIFTMIKDKPTFPSAQTGVGWSHLIRFQRKHNDFPETIEDSPPPTSTWKFPRLHQKHLDQCSCKALLDVILLVVATPLKNISQIGNLFQVGVKTKNI